ncbi:hypothetical protein PMR95_09860, partial [Bifidobacterium longum]|nr:hypothetical protein [Bifidobacterium longum]
MIQEPPACPVCGLAVEERDPRRGKPLSIHRACRNRRREELRKERERGRRMSQESLLMCISSSRCFVFSHVFFSGLGSCMHFPYFSGCAEVFLPNM